MSPVTSSSSLVQTNFLLRKGKHARALRIVDVTRDTLIIYACAAPAQDAKNISEVFGGKCARRHLSVMMFSRSSREVAVESLERVWRNFRAMCLERGDFVELQTSGAKDISNFCFFLYIFT